MVNKRGELERDDVALAGGVVRLLRPTLAGHFGRRVTLTASTPWLIRRRVGHREWGLRPQTPPPAEMSMVAYNGAASALTGKLRMALAVFAAPNPLSGRWFGCPGAGPIRARDRCGIPGKALMSQCQHAKPLQRERGPEHGHPDRLPANNVNNEQAKPRQPP